MMNIGHNEKYVNGPMDHMTKCLIMMTIMLLLEGTTHKMIFVNLMKITSKF
jgi:hypothetical protein